MCISERVAGFIEREAMLEPGQSVLVGVSGGPDSLCLLDCLIRLKYQTVVAHFDHQLREDSTEDVEFVNQVAGAYDVPFKLGEETARRTKGSIEEAARLSRYRFLTSTARKLGITHIAVGHTANDQAETVLMHLIRGAGSSGLRGMLPVTVMNDWVGFREAEGMSLVRPLLEIWRYETEDYCARHGIEVRMDPSNQDPNFFRNRLRNELLPQLQTYNPRVQEVLLRTAKVMAAEAEAIEDLVESRWSDWASAAGDGVLALHPKVLFQEPLALQRSAVRRAILQLVPELRDVGFDTVERALSSMHDGTRRTLMGGLDLFTLNGEAYLRLPDAHIVLPGIPQIASPETQTLSIPSEVELDNGWKLTLEEMAPTQEIPQSKYEVWFDASELDGSLEMRGPSPGDRMVAFGMSGSTKLSDLFGNRKVPWPARKRWPVICCGEIIAWVAGLQRAEIARVTPDTERIVRMKLEPPSEPQI